MDNFLDLAAHRSSIRRYSGTGIPRKDLDRCIEAARLAPSASNSQPWKFIVVDDPGLKDKVAANTWDPVIRFNNFTMEAPVMVVIMLEGPKLITKVGKAVKNKEWPHMDIGIAAEHFCLQAAEMGIGTCMIGWFSEKPLKELLHIPKNKEVALLISVGYPKTPGQIKEKKRKSLAQIRTFNAYR